MQIMRNRAYTTVIIYSPQIFLGCHKIRDKTDLFWLTVLCRWHVGKELYARWQNDPEFPHTKNLELVRWPSGFNAGEELWNPGETRHGSTHLQSRNSGNMDSGNKEIQEVSRPAILVYTGDMVRVPILSKREDVDRHSRCPLTSTWALWHMCICTNTR